ncbi:MAG: hypothetical protein AAB847_00640 [Patescibacteria group bacterium]
MKKPETTLTFQEAEKAIKTIKTIIPKLSEGEKATLELILDEDAQNAISQSAEDFERGDVLTLEELKNL